MPKMPESQRFDKSKQQLLETRNTQKQGSNKKANDADKESIGSLVKGIQKLSDYCANDSAKQSKSKEKHIKFKDDGSDAWDEKVDPKTNQLKGTAPKPKDKKEYGEDNDINLSELDEDQRKELVDLEMQIEQANLTRGERRRLQNKRNVLKAKIKKELETEGHKHTISKLQKRVILLKK